MKTGRILKLHHPTGHPYWQRNHYKIEMPDGSFFSPKDFFFRHNLDHYAIEYFVKPDGIYIQLFHCSSGMGKCGIDKPVLCIASDRYDEIIYAGKPLMSSRELAADLAENGLPL